MGGAKGFRGGALGRRKLFERIRSAGFVSKRSGLDAAREQKERKADQTQSQPGPPRPRSTGERSREIRARMDPILHRLTPPRRRLVQD